jgi:hypothetical protein
MLEAYLYAMGTMLAISLFCYGLKRETPWRTWATPLALAVVWPISAPILIVIAILKDER